MCTEISREMLRRAQDRMAGKLPPLELSKADKALLRSVQQAITPLGDGQRLRDIYRAASLRHAQSDRV